MTIASPTNAIGVTLTPGSGFEVRVFDVANPNTLLAYIPNPVSVQFEDVLNDVGSGQVVVETEDVPWTIFDKDNIWRINWDGIERFAFLGEQVEEQYINDTETHVRTVAGRGLGAWLEKVKVYPVVMDQPDTPRNFNNNPLSGNTAAGIWKWLLLEAQNRGTATQVTFVNGWDATKDSEGVNWTDVHNMQVPIGPNLLDLLGQLSTAVPFDWHMASRFDLALALSYGANLYDKVRIAPSGSLLTSTTTTDSKDLWTVFLVQDSNNACSDQVDSTAITTYGRREQFASSDTVVDSTGRHDYAYQLLQQYKVLPKQRAATIAGDILGSQPYVDFNLGDIISVEVTTQVPFPGPDDIIVKARVVGIAMSAGGNDQFPTVHAEVTLDFMFGKTLEPFNSSPASSTGSQFQIVYADIGNVTRTINTNIQLMINLLVHADSPTWVQVATYLRGQASVAQTMEADIVINGNLIRVLKQLLQAGEVTWTPEFVIPSLPEGDNTCQLRMKVDTGTFAIAPFDLQHWYEGYSLAGGIPQGDTSISVVDSFPYTQVLSDHTPTSVATQTPTGSALRTRTDTITPYHTLTDVDPTLAYPGYVLTPGAGANDGSSNSSPTFSNSSTTLEAGNDGGVIWGSYMRFVIPAPGMPVAGTSIVYARLVLMGDAADNNANLIIHAERAASPTAPTSTADYNGRTRTTAGVTWAPGAVASGTAFTSIDFSSVNQELVNAYGNSITAIQIFVDDNTGPLNGKARWRSQENAANNPPQLVVRWHY